MSSTTSRRPYTGAICLRIDRDLYAVERGMAGGYFIRDLRAGELIREHLEGGFVSEGPERFEVFEDAIDRARDYARNTRAGVVHDFPSTAAAIAWAQS